MNKSLVTFNIGLNVQGIFNPELQELITKTINPLRFRIDTGKYLDCDSEPTYVCQVLINPIGLDIYTETLCSLFEQDCISYKHETAKKLIYRPDYTGERFDFSDEYFINF